MSSYELGAYNALLLKTEIVFTKFLKNKSLLSSISDDVDEGGTSVSCLGETKVPMGQHPVLLFGGEVSLQTQSGKLVKLTLSTHETSPNNNDYSNEEMKQVIKKNISLGRFTNAWTLCQVLKDSDVMEELAKAAMKRLGNIIISVWGCP